MKKFVVTWTFIRHIHRHREYKIVTSIIEADDTDMANYGMFCSKEVKKLIKDSYSPRLKSYVSLDDMKIKTGYIY